MLFVFLGEYVVPLQKDVIERNESYRYICNMKGKREHILNEIKKTLHAVAPDAKAVLFGSRARNEARDDSDWDILILIEKDKIRNEDFDAVAYPLVELGWTLGEMINPVLYTFNEWRKRSFTIFHKNIEEEGIVI